MFLPRRACPVVPYPFGTRNATRRMTFACRLLVRLSGLRFPSREETRHPSDCTAAIDGIYDSGATLSRPE